MRYNDPSINWEEIQNYYEECKSQKKVRERFGLSVSNVMTALKHGVMKRLDPEDNLYKNHYWGSPDRFDSVPCRHLKNELLKNGITFYPEYNDPNWEHKYRLDIALVNIKVDIEVNGSQHYGKDGKLLDKYQARHDYLTSLGWTVIEVPYMQVWDQSFVDSVIGQIKNNKGFAAVDYTELIKEELKRKEQYRIDNFVCPICGGRKSRSYICRKCNTIRLRKKYKEKGSCKKADVNLNQVICFLENGEPFTKVAKRFGVTDNAVRKWLRAAGIDPKQFINKQEFTELTYKGVTKSINKWGIDLHISPATIRKRLKEGKTVEEALQVGKVNLNKKVKLYTIDGVQATVPQIAKMKKIPLMTLRHRLEKGLTIEEAVKPKK